MCVCTATCQTPGSASRVPELWDKKCVCRSFDRGFLIHSAIQNHFGVENENCTFSIRIFTLGIVMLDTLLPVNFPIYFSWLTVLLNCYIKCVVHFWC